MKHRRLRLAVGVVLGAVGLFLALSQGKSIGDIPAGTGYAALELCTRTMQSGEGFDHVRTRYVEPKVHPLPWFWQVEHVPGEHVTVRTWLPFFAHPRTAVFRAGLGCTVVPPATTEAAVRAMSFRPAPALEADPRPWPDGEAEAEAARLGDAARTLVERHARDLFGESTQDPKRQRNTTALLVARDGHLVYERYGHGYTRHRPQLGWSMTKTLTAIVAGTLAREGKLALDEAVGLAHWKGTPKAEITWRQLLNMAPGLEWFEGYGGASDATQMLFSTVDEGVWAADRPLTSKPGTVFTYSTGFSNVAMRRMRELLGGSHQVLYDHYQRVLFAPLGIRGGVIEPDASGTPVGGARGLLRPVDWLRLGQLVADGGRRHDAVILDPAWVAFMTAASPATDEYGGSIWREASPKIAAETRARLPDDLVFFAGHLGQFTVVVPSKNLVVLRMGVDLGGTFGDDPTLNAVMRLVADLLEA